MAFCAFPPPNIVIKSLMYKLSVLVSNMHFFILFLLTDKLAVGLISNFNCLLNNYFELEDTFYKADADSLQ